MKTFNEIPSSEPSTDLLNELRLPEDLKKLSKKDLNIVADQVREFLLYSVGVSGGHFGAGLGVVELTVALHHVFDSPKDKIVWDVGHQSYPHKILTGRKKDLKNIRKNNGLHPFPFQR